MRHRNKTIKLGRTSRHRDAMLSNMVCSLIKERRITTTLAKAKAARSVAEKMVTFGKTGTLAARRIVIARLHLHGPDAEVMKNKVTRARWDKDENIARILFDEIAPSMKDRNGGYTRIYKLGPRRSDGAEEAILEWVNYVPPAAPVKEEKTAKGAKPAADEAPAAEAKPKAKRTKKAATTEKVEADAKA